MPWAHGMLFCSKILYLLSSSLLPFLCGCRHLLSLKHYEGDIEELDLNFTLTVDDFGQSKVT